MLLLTTTTTALADRVDALDWDALGATLDDRGFAITEPLLHPDECDDLAALFDDGRFRSTIDMARHRFGDGRYRSFDHPLPAPIEELRGALYRRLAPVANRWSTLLSGDNPTFPAEHEELLARCRAAGQERPTPLILRYGPGDWNALHRDLYGDLVFPLQVVIGLDAPGDDYTGGEFVVVEQRPRAQSRATTSQIGQGDGIVFTTRDRPLRSTRGWVAAPMRHGVSTLRTGRRHTLGLVFHDAH